jgi:hypothetical protein
MLSICSTTELYTQLKYCLLLFYFVKRQGLSYVAQPGPEPMDQTPK